MKKLFISGLFWMVLGLSACTKVPTLDSPCPQYGRFCPQEVINDDC